VVVRDNASLTQLVLDVDSGGQYEVSRNAALTELRIIGGQLGRTQIFDNPALQTLSIIGYGAGVTVANHPKLRAAFFQIANGVVNFTNDSADLHDLTAALAAGSEIVLSSTTPLDRIVFSELGAAYLYISDTDVGALVFPERGTVVDLHVDGGRLPALDTRSLYVSGEMKLMNVQGLKTVSTGAVDDLRVQTNPDLTSLSTQGTAMQRLIVSKNPTLSSLAAPALTSLGLATFVDNPALSTCTLQALVAQVHLPADHVTNRGNLEEACGP
jgi:hypothetical protein